MATVTAMAIHIIDMLSNHSEASVTNRSSGAT